MTTQESYLKQLEKDSEALELAGDFEGSENLYEQVLDGLDKLNSYRRRMAA